MINVILYYYNRFIVQCQHTQKYVQNYKVCSRKIQSVRLGNQSGAFYLCRSRTPRHKHSRNPTTNNPPQPSKINIYKNISKYLPYAYRTYDSYNCSYFSTSKLCHSSLLTSKLACHFLIFYLFFSIF
jgi:hypothetical protein